MWTTTAVLLNTFPSLGWECRSDALTFVLMHNAQQSIKLTAAPFSQQSFDLLLVIYLCNVHLMINPREINVEIDLLWYICEKLNDNGIGGYANIHCSVSQYNSEDFLFNF